MNSAKTSASFLAMTTPILWINASGTSKRELPDITELNVEIEKIVELRVSIDEIVADIEGAK